MTYKTLFLFALMLIAAAPLSAQEVSPQSPANDKTAQQKAANLAAVEEKTIAVLKTAGREAAALNLPENRVRHLSDAAEMLWQHDEKTARTMFVNALNDFRLIMQSLDTLQQRIAAGEADESLQFFGGGGGNNHRLFYQTQNVRRNLLLAVAKYDPQLAHDFFRETQRENFKEYGWHEGDLETQLAALMANNDPSRALALGQQKLAKNEFDGISNLTLNLYRKDAEKGAKLAAEITNKLRDMKLTEVNWTAWSAASTLLTDAAEIEGKPNADKKPLLSKSELTSLSETILRIVVEGRQKGGYYYLDNYGKVKTVLQKYAPAAYAATEGKTAATVSAAVETAASEETAGAGTGPATVETTNITAVVRGVTTSPAEAPADSLMNLVQKGTADKNEKISSEEIRKKLSAVRGRNVRFVAAAQVIRMLAEAGQKEAAKELLPEINSFQVVQPRKAGEMMQNLLFADAISAIDPDRAFLTVENTLIELNSVAAVFLRLGEFFDAKEVMDNSEFNMNGFSKEFLRPDGGMGGFGLQKMLINLAAADYDRTLALADKLERPELRLEAKMLIVRSLLPVRERAASE